MHIWTYACDNAPCSDEISVHWQMFRALVDMVSGISLSTFLAAFATLGRGQQEAASTNSSTPVLVNFQVAQPLTFPSSLKTCTVHLIHHNFASSYYQPAIAEYTPPTACGPPSTWAGVSGNYTVTSNGTQYDRLSGVTFQNVEIWRTSTAEPSPTGIIWTALKDLSHYIPLFSKPGRIIIDLNNVVDLDSGLNGEYDVTFSVTIYAARNGQDVAPRSDQIAALGTLSSSQAGYGSAPPGLNTSISLPRNTAQAFAEIYASGNSQEEFWYFNAPDAWLPALPKDTTYGKGPFMEVQLLVDGYLAGFASPYPVLFTGANVPLIWRPVAAYGAFDQPTYKVDLTPWIPLLADGKNHTVSLNVVSAERDHAVLGNWWISGNIQVSLDKSGKLTTGRITRYSAPAYAKLLVSGVKSVSGRDVNITVSAQHSLHVEADIYTGSGGRSRVAWQQNYAFNNVQSYTNDAETQVSKQTSWGWSLSTHNGIVKVEDDFSYPLQVGFWNLGGNGTGYGSSFDHAYNRKEILPFQITSSIQTHRYSVGSRYTPTNGTRINKATSDQTFQYRDAKGNTYSRHIKAANGTVTEDKQGGSLAKVNLPDWSFESSKAKLGGDWAARVHGPNGVVDT